MVIPVMFLRSYGLASIDSIQLQQLPANRTTGYSPFPEFQPASEWAEMAQRASDVVHRSRVQPDADFEQEMRELMQEYHDVFFDPLRSPSIKCNQASINLAVAYAEQIRVIGGGGNQDLFLDATKLAPQIARDCYLQSAEPCMDWRDPAQVQEVRHWRLYAAAMTEAYDPGNAVIPLEELPRCPIVEVRPGADGGFIYPLPPDPESGWFTKVHFLFPAADARTVVFANMFSVPGAALARVTARLKMQGQDWVTEDWTNLPYPWFCRDMREGRIEELIITSSHVITAPLQAPSLDATNVGCWRWTAHVTMTQTVRPKPHGYGDWMDVEKEGDVVIESQQARGVMDLDATTFGYHYTMWAKGDGATPFAAVSAQIEVHVLYHNQDPQGGMPACYFEETWSLAPQTLLNRYFNLSFNPRFRLLAAGFSEDPFSEAGRWVRCPAGAWGNDQYIHTAWWRALPAVPFGADGTTITGQRVWQDDKDWTTTVFTSTWNMTAQSQP